MYPVLLDVGPVKIYSWGFMLAVAILIILWGAGKQYRKAGYPPDTAMDLVLIAVIAGVIGSRVAYILVYEWDEFLIDPLIMFQLTDGGLSGLMWYGGLTLGFLACWLYVRLKKFDFWEMADLLAPWLALGYALVRVGCFLNGCCYGKVAALGGVVFPHVDHFSRYPTQLYSTAVNLALFVFLLYYYQRRKFTGEVFSFYFIGYAIYRFLIEFLREGPIVWLVFTPSQTYSFFILPLGLLIYFYCRHKYYRSVPGKRPDNR